MMVAVGSGGRGGARRVASSYRRREKYLRFVLPAVVVIVAVIIFPWIFTVFMSLHDWQVASPRTWVGLDNYANLLSDERFRAAIGRTFIYTLLAVVFPVVIGTAAAMLFHREFPLRGFLRSIYILPMVATPVAIALVWTMMFHPQLGVLNYLLTRVGLPPSLWVYSPQTVKPPSTISITSGVHCHVSTRTNDGMTVWGE